MFSKAINLNMKIGKNDFSKAIGISVAGYVLAALAGVIPLVICIIAFTVFSIKGLNNIFNASLFNDEGAFYMALPLSEKDIVLSKVAAGSIYMFLLDLVSVAAIFIITIVTLVSGLDITEVYTSLIQPYLDIGMPASQIAILMGLLPLNMLLQQIFFCSFAFAVLLFFNLIKPGRLSVAAWIVIFGINAALTKGTDFLSGKLLESGFNAFLLEGAADILYVAIILGLLSYCVKALGNKYNV